MGSELVDGLAGLPDVEDGDGGAVLGEGGEEVRVVRGGGDAEERGGGGEGGVRGLVGEGGGGEGLGCLWGVSLGGLG